MGKKNAAQNMAMTIFFSLLSILWLCPIALVVLNSFKKKAYISRRPFAIPTDKMFVGLENYINGIEKPASLRPSGGLCSLPSALCLSSFCVPPCVPGILCG